MRDHLVCPVPQCLSSVRNAHRSLRVMFAILAVAFVLVGRSEAIAADPPALGSIADQGSPSAAAGRLVLVQRTLHQDQGDWQVDYTFRNAGAEALNLQPRDLGVRTEGWVSNSRIATHATPRLASSAVDGQFASTAFADLIAGDEVRRCRERVVLSVLPQPPTPTPEATASRSATPGQSAPTMTPTRTITGSRNPLPTLAAVVVEPGGVVRIQLRYEHLHAIFGEYDPLLGRRDLELRLGATFFRDTLPLAREQYQALPRDSWPEPPEDRRDRRYSVSGPDSLRLDTDLPGNNLYRFAERKIRYSTPMRLRFWYRVAPGTEGQLHARVSQSRAEPYKYLTDGGMDIVLASNGHWTRFERVFRTEAEATELALAFHITLCDIGEAWIDDVVLEPVDGPAPGP